MPVDRAIDTALADLAFLSDTRTAALVDREGSIRWHCPLAFDSPSVFGSLLDARAGHWRIGPAGSARTTRRYLPDSLVLETEFTAPDGVVRLTDLLAVDPVDDAHALGRHVPNVLARRVEAISGRPVLEVEVAPRFEYGLTTPHLRGADRRWLIAAGPLALDLVADVPLEDRDGSLVARFELAAGEAAGFTLAARSAHDPAAPAIEAPALLDATTRAWSRWATLHHGYDGHALDAVRTSARILQGLTDARTGAVVAAATTSLPEIVGGDANWDYRFAWLRDLAFVMRALWVAACPDEADAFLTFLADALGRQGKGPVPIMLGSDGRRAIAETELRHLRGYRDSRPVRIGNAAWRQRQLDVPGEVLDSAHLLRDRIGDLGPEVRALLVGLAERAARDWDVDDAGMWEARDRERPYTSSKVLAWVALDRAIALGERLGDRLPLDRWRSTREEIRQAILDRAWDERIGAFAGAFGSDRLDASVLLMPLLDFLPATEPRMAATIRAIRERLTSGPLVHRWDGDTNGFLLASFWLAECEALLGEHDAARARFDALAGAANDVGILAEMAAPGTLEPIGNLPQAFSHVGLINAAWRLSELERRPSAAT